jgi:hypothetical protein
VALPPHFGSLVLIGTFAFMSMLPKQSVLLLIIAVVVPHRCNLFMKM